MLIFVALVGDPSERRLVPRLRARNPDGAWSRRIERLACRPWCSVAVVNTPWSHVVEYFGKNHLWDFIFLAVLGAIALAIKLMDWFGARPGGRRGVPLEVVELVRSELLADVAGLAADAHGNL